MRFLRQSLSGLLLLALTLGLLVYGGQVMVSAFQARMAEELKAPERREREYTATLVTAQSRTVTPILTAYGEIQSRRTLEIRAKTAGTLMELADNFENGGVVNAGERLARVDPQKAEFALSRAESELADSIAERREAERALVLAKDELEASIDQSALREKAFQRQLDLESRGVGTAASVEATELSASQARQSVIIARKAVAAAEARLDQAETRISRSEIALEEAEQQLEDTEIFARFSGTLSDVTVVEGRLVSINEKLGTVIDGDALEVSFRVSTAQYARLTDASGALIKAPVKAVLTTFGQDLEFQGRITRDSAEVGANQIGRVLFATLDNAATLKPGDFVTVMIEEPQLDNVVRLPASALGPAGDVLILGAENRLTVLPVKLLRRQGDDILVQGEGIDGKQVLVDRTPLMGEGVKVVPFLAGSEAYNTPASELLELTEERRARLIAFVQSSLDMSEEIKTRMVGQLEQATVPAGLVERLERRIDG
jgi:RND family efflux transporter MFP subunit